MSRGRPIRRIVVAGGGIVGLSAALAFARALPQARVQLIDLPVSPDALADRLPGTLPAMRHFNRLAGIDEPAMVRQSGASFRLGTRFEDWAADGRSWVHCFGRHGSQVDNSPFHHQWLRLRSEGSALEFSAYAPAAAIAAAGKFVHPSEDRRTLLGSFDYALRVEPDSYRDLLRERAAAARVALRAGEIAEVAIEDGRVSVLRLGDGREIRADLYIDCAGPKAPILSRLTGAFEDWGEVLPFRHLAIEEDARMAQGPLDVATATPGGYRLAIPLRSGGLRISVSADQPVDSLEGSPVAFRTGRRPASWVGNVVAFGDSAVVVDPLESTNLHLAQSAIRRAVSLIPDADFHPLVLREFNRRTAGEADRIRDFIAVHFMGSSRRRGGFWEGLPSRRAPASLAHTLTQFKDRARLPRYEEETFDDDSWLAVLFGLGLQPKRLDPTVHRVDVHRARAMLDRIAGSTAALPQGLPSYQDYMRQLVSG